MIGRCLLVWPVSAGAEEVFGFWSAAVVHPPRLGRVKTLSGWRITWRAPQFCLVSRAVGGVLGHLAVEVI